MTTVKQRLFDAVIARLRTILPANGYATDAGVKVFVNRDTVTERIGEKDLPCITIREGPETVEILTAAVQRNSVPYDIAGHYLEAEDPSTHLRAIYGDLQEAMIEDPTFDGLAQYCQPTASEITTERGGKNVGSIRLPYEIRYQHPVTDPFTVHVQPT